ncbi:hypothetical protein CCHR01_19255 [Colletotrichum chrysophilum]|uniref:Uncharacterized protein n=1 Tax=Colletotrichum chrysophilum TaxID=1836956 RepID=A0AAD8ZYT8_9PEZI|nr:hypothetical protein CCHR01_19255 [Colletotrichum chrysophilum]
MDDFQCLAASVEAHWFRASDRGRHTGFLAPVPLCWGEDGQADRRRKDQNTPQRSNSSGAGQNTRLLLTHSANISHAPFLSPSLCLFRSLSNPHTQNDTGGERGRMDCGLLLVPRYRGVLDSAHLGLCLKVSSDWACPWGLSRPTGPDMT